jgi:hypothetical protein
MEDRPMKMGMRPFALVAVLALAGAACEDGVTDTNSFDDLALLEDAAMVAADGMFQDLAHMVGPSTWAGFESPPEATPIQIEGTKTFSRTVTFYDALNNEQDGFVPGETFKMTVVSNLTRDVSHSFWTASITRNRNMTVEGLLDNEIDSMDPTWNGNGSSVVSKSRHPEGTVVRTRDMECTSTVTDVVRLIPRWMHPYPKSGTIARTCKVTTWKEGEDPVEMTVTITITFDGDNTATMTDGTNTWEINLDDRGVKRRFKAKNG